MKPSEYIRIGCELRPRQAFGFMYEPGEKGSCAVGAFIDGWMYPSAAYSANYWLQIVEAFQLDRLSEQSTCPLGCPADHTSAMGFIAHLNDVHHWTRERIGEWLDTQVPQEEPVEEEELVMV